MTPDQKKYILQWLRDNQSATAYEAANTLEELGYPVSQYTVRRYRTEFNIPIVKKVTAYQRAMNDIQNGYKFDTVYDLVNKYKLSYSYAGMIYAKVKGKQERKGNPKYASRSKEVVEPKVLITAPPVRVNTMEHAVHQLIRCAA